MLDTDSLNLEKIKQDLLGTKACDVHDTAAFISTFVALSTALAKAEASEKRSTLKIDTMALWFTRALQLTRLKDDFHEQFQNCGQSLQLMCVFTHVCQAFASGSGPFTNAASGLLSKLLQFTSNFCVYSEDSSMIHEMSGLVLAIPSSQKSFFSIAESLMKVFDSAASIFSERGDYFPKKCLEVMKASPLANSASKAFVLYYTRLHDPQSNSLSYISAWSPLVLEHISIVSERANILNQLLPKLFKPCPERFIEWIKSLNLDHRSTEILPLLKCALSLSPSNDPISLGVMTETELLRLLKNSNESCRQDAWALVCTAFTAKAYPPEYALNSILDPLILQIFFKECLAPESRSSFFSSSRKAIVNCRDYIATLENRFLKKPDHIQEARIHELKMRMGTIYDFVTSQMVPDSSYSQLTLCTDFLNLFIEFEFDGIERGVRKDIKTSTKVFDIFTQQLVSTLLRLVSNNYEDIRLRCSNMLASCPFETFQSINDEKMMINTLDLLSSFKGRQSDGGAEVFKALGQIYLANNRSHDLLRCLHLILTNLNRKLGEDLPVHGHIRAIGEVLELMTPSFYEEHQLKLNPIFASLLHTSFQMWEIIKPQMIAAPFTDDADADSQCWRSVKENSYLLTVIINLNNLSRAKILEEKTFVNICDLLMDQLSNISHRGAFAAIYPTFVRACELCYHTNLDGKPFDWLQANLQLLETKEQLISRRSAGLPFLITAILNSCVTYPTRLDNFLEYTFSELFRVASMNYVPHADEKNDLPQVHAFNCLKCLFKESALSQAVQSYIEEALKLSISHLDHPAWAIKNGAVMLFTALQERIFGSQTIGELESCKNASLFFRRYPGIESILLQKLEHSNSLNDIFVVLSILLRLQTFSHTDTTLAPFTKIIILKVLGHRSWKIREMASKLLCLMTHIHVFPKLVSRMAQFEDLTQNEIHGRLMCLLEITTLTKRSRMDHSYIIERLNEWTLEALKDSSWTVLRATILILENGKPTPAVLQALKLRIDSILSNERRPLNGPLRLFIESAVKLALTASNDSAEAILLSRNYLTATFYEAQIATLEFWEKDCPAFRSASGLHSIVVDLIQDDKSWNLVKTKCLRLLLDSDIVIQGALLPLVNWNQNMHMLYLVLEARLEGSNKHQVIESAEKLAMDNYHEKSRQLSLAACKSLLSCGFKDEIVAARARLLLYEKLSDESSKVRSEACIGDACAAESEKHVLDELVQHHQNISITLFSERLQESITKNIRDFLLEKENTFFELERSNLYRNEVNEAKDLINSLIILISKQPIMRLSIEKVAARCVESVVGLIKANEELISSWTFNVHLDSAIRKVSQLGPICSESVKTEILQMKNNLREKHYYI